MSLRQGYDADESKLRAAMLVVYNHMHKIKSAQRQALLDALQVMKDHVDSNEWVCYRP